MEARSHYRERRTLGRRLRRLVRRLVILLLVLAAIGAGLWSYAIHRVDRENGLAVSVGYALVIEGKGIETRDVAIYHAGGDSPEVPLLRVDKLLAN